MFIGHFALGYAAKWWAPWPVACDPYSHSLAMLLLWGALFAWICARGAGSQRRVFAVVLALVVTAFLVIAFIANATSPPPPSVAMIWISALILGGLIVALSYWADNHRRSA